jgi:hypothetical protein
VVFGFWTPVPGPCACWGKHLSRLPKALILFGMVLEQDPYTVQRMFSQEISAPSPTCSCSTTYTPELVGWCVCMYLWFKGRKENRWQVQGVIASTGPWLRGEWQSYTERFHTPHWHREFDSPMWYVRFVLFSKRFLVGSNSQLIICQAVWCVLGIQRQIRYLCS